MTVLAVARTTFLMLSVVCNDIPKCGSFVKASTKLAAEELQSCPANIYIMKLNGELETQWTVFVVLSNHAATYIISRHQHV